MLMHIREGFVASHWSLETLEYTKLCSCLLLLECQGHPVFY
jgi:hypothetical protein